MINDTKDYYRFFFILIILNKEIIIILNIKSLWRSGKRTGLRIQGSWVRPPPGTRTNFFLKSLYHHDSWVTSIFTVVVPRPEARPPAIHNPRAVGLRYNTRRQLSGNGTIIIFTQNKTGFNSIFTWNMWYFYCFHHFIMLIKIT